MILFKYSPQRRVYISGPNGCSELCKLSVDEFLELFGFGFIFVKWTLSFAGELISSTNFVSPLKDLVKSWCLLFDLGFSNQRDFLHRKEHACGFSGFCEDFSSHLVLVVNWAPKDVSSFHSSALVLISFKISLAFLLLFFHSINWE